MAQVRARDGRAGDDSTQFLVRRWKNLLKPPIMKTLKYMEFYFLSFNFTIVTFFSPFLVKYERNKLNTEFQVYLDILDEKWTSNYSKDGYVVIAAGQWYHKIKIVMLEDGKIIGCHIQGKNTGKSA